MLKLRIEAGRHDRVNCPVIFEVAEIPDGPVLRRRGDGLAIPCQVVESADNRNVLCCIIPHMGKGAVEEFCLIGNENLCRDIPGVAISSTETKLDIAIGDEYFTSYVFAADNPKPYLGPVMGPYGDSITRLDFDTKEHPHHRSLWFSHGDVNGVDTWNEQGNDHGFERHLGFDYICGGPVFGAFSSRNTWTDFHGKPLLDDSRSFRIYNTGKHLRIMDLSLTLKASYGRVELGATKEAGPLGIRVADSMTGTSGGTLVSAYGGVGEPECWGKRSPWCDYFGPVSGKIVGVAAFDCPDNGGYPSFWHIRDYGLMAINNYFFSGAETIEEGRQTTQKFRVIFHCGNADEARIGDRFHDYINPPRMSVLGR